MSVERLPGSVNVCGRAAAKGPRAAARHKVTTQFREILRFFLDLSKFDLRRPQVAYYATVAGERVCRLAAATSQILNQNIKWDRNHCKTI